MAARHSLYPGAAYLPQPSFSVSPSTALSSIANCCASVSQCCEKLENSASALSEATSDFPRLARVLSSRRHFDLVSEADVRHARAQLSLEIAPQLRELIPMAEQAVEREKKAMTTLRNKHAQITQRQAQMASLHAPPPPARGAAAGRAGGATTAQVAAQKKRNDDLRRKKEELQARVEKMEKDIEREEAEASLLAASANSRVSS